MEHVTFDKNDHAVCHHPRFVPMHDGIAQCSPAWFKQRRGRLTGSKYANLYFIGSEAEYEQYWQQVWNKGPREPFSEEAKGYMEYGKKHEDVALSQFLTSAPATVGDIYIAESPFYPHLLNYLGASPDGTYAIYKDGVMAEEGIIEIKAPAKTKRPYAHFKYYYVSQTYAEMACSGMRSCIAISWGPRCMRAWRWKFEPEVWNVVCNMIEGFRQHVPYTTFQELQHELIQVSERVSKSAECLHPGKGWTP